MEATPHRSPEHSQFPGWHLQQFSFIYMFEYFSILTAERSKKQKQSQEPWAVCFPLPAQAPGWVFSLLCHLFALGDLLCIICALFLSQHFLLLTRCPSVHQAVSSDIPAWSRRRAGNGFPCTQSWDKQQSLCALPASEISVIPGRGREQQCCTTATCLFQDTTSWPSKDSVFQRNPKTALTEILTP